MGVSIIWIILHHIQFFNVAGFGILDYFVKGGNIGVDIFLFLSGYGLFHSYTNNSNIVDFYRKRFIRIIPTFVILIVIYNFLKGDFKSIFNPWMWYWQFYGNWFISFILLMYLSFPLFFKLQKLKLSYPLITTIIISFILTVLLIIKHKNDIHDVPMLMAQRSPIFVLGMIVADKRFTLQINYKLYCLIFTLIVCFIFYRDLDDILYPAYFFLTYPLVLLLSKTIRRLPLKIQRVLDWTGKRSLELYLVHMIITPILQNVKVPICIKLLLVFILSVIGAIILKTIVSFVLKYLKIKH